MTMRTNCILLLVILLGAFPLSVHADESGSIILYTPYTKISVTPGASIDYSIDLINNTDGVTNANLSVSGLPGWSVVNSVWKFLSGPRPPPAAVWFLRQIL